MDKYSFWLLLYFVAAIQGLGDSSECGSGETFCCDPLDPDAQEYTLTQVKGCVDSGNCSNPIEVPPFHANNCTCSKSFIYDCDAQICKPWDANANFAFTKNGCEELSSTIFGLAIPDFILALVGFIITITLICVAIFCCCCKKQNQVIVVATLPDPKQ